MPKSLDISISLTVPEVLRNSISLAFGPFESEEDEEKVIKGFAEMSLKACADWLAGNKRYRSLTEQYIDWVEQIYLLFLPESEMPSAERIYNSFNMPYGQASYVARVLASKKLVPWRKKALDELYVALKDVEEAARGYVTDGDLGQPISIEVSEIALIELSQICSRRKRIDRGYLMPQHGARSGDYRFVSVPACTVVDLIDNP